MLSHGAEGTGFDGYSSPRQTKAFNYPFSSNTIIEIRSKKHETLVKSGGMDAIY